MKHKNSIISSFKVALKGLKIAFISEKNIKIHSIIALLTLILSFICQLSTIEIAIILLCIGIVISLELINTALESFLNLYSTQYNSTIKNIKDIAAASVLFISTIAFTIGCVIFIPKCLKYIELWK
jgi:diacylglycerol kinase